MNRTVFWPRKDSDAKGHPISNAWETWDTIAREIMRLLRLYIVRIAVLFFCLNTKCLAFNGWKLLIDAQGDGHYSRYNFTDLKHPYEGIDAWGELKAALWPKTDKAISPYVSIIPATTTESEFWWQRNTTSAVGLQLYPADFIQTHVDRGPAGGNWLRNLRLYATYGVREYYDKPHNADPEDEDFRVGFDYYHDNLFHKDVLTYLVWTNLTYRSTNYSLREYDAMVWEGLRGVRTSWGQDFVADFVGSGLRGVDP